MSDISYSSARDRGTAWLLDAGQRRWLDRRDGPGFSLLPAAMDIHHHRSHRRRGPPLPVGTRASVRGKRRLYVGVTPRQIEANTYQNATFIYGAQMLRQYDLSYRGWSHLLTRQDRRAAALPISPAGTIAGRREHPDGGHGG